MVVLITHSPTQWLFGRREGGGKERKGKEEEVKTERESESGEWSVRVECENGVCERERNFWGKKVEMK